MHARNAPMSNRKTVNRIREQFAEIEGALRELEKVVPSQNARHLFAKARAMVRAGATLMAQAATGQLDGGTGLSTVPPTVTAVRQALAGVPATIVSISPGAMRMRLRCVETPGVDLAIAQAMADEGWKRNRYGYWLRPDAAAVAAAS